MKKELSLWQFTADTLLAGEDVMLLVVAESSGSSPGRQGFKMAVRSDGQIHGSIGGGIMEVKLVELARKLLEEKNIVPIVKKQIHNKSAPVHQSGMICSGEQTVIYFKLSTEHSEAVTKIIQGISKYGTAVISISFKANISQLSVEDSLDKKMKPVFVKTNEEEFHYAEKIGYSSRLYIVGGGHCSLALSELMAKHDFYIHVIDDRPDLNTLEQNIYANEKHVIESYELIDQIIPPGEDVYVVVMTLGYRSDLLALLKLLKKPFAYLGLMGSEAKVSTLKDELQKAGIPEMYIDAMHSPIGLPINSHTPEEIAVSIAAQIIQVKNSLVG